MVFGRSGQSYSAGSKGSTELFATLHGRLSRSAGGPAGTGSIQSAGPYCAYLQLLLNKQMCTYVLLSLISVSQQFPLHFSLYSAVCVCTSSFISLPSLH